jgi:hypothetical protein
MQDSLKLAVREVEAKRGKKSDEEVSANLTKPYNKNLTKLSALAAREVEAKRGKLNPKLKQDEVSLTLNPS